MKLTSIEIRSRSPPDLKLPKTPSNLKALKKPELIKLIDRYNDYWSTWLQRATMFPEYPSLQSYKPAQLRKLVALVSNDLAQEAFNNLYDYNKLPELNLLFCTKFFEDWDEIVR